jgi:hypothetical protein
MQSSKYCRGSHAFNTLKRFVPVAKRFTTEANRLHFARCGSWPLALSSETNVERVSCPGQSTSRDFQLSAIKPAMRP